MIGCGIRTLQGYESDTDGRPVPEDIVERMADAYRAPMLAWWHLKHNSPLGRFLPDIVVTQSTSDMGMQISLAGDDLVETFSEIKRLLADGEITANEYSDLTACVEALRRATGRTISATTFAEQRILATQKGR